MSLYAGDSSNSTTRANGKRWMGLAAYALVSGAAAWAVVHLLAAPPNIETQVSLALGCRNDDHVLILKLASDNRMVWPDGTVCSVEESVALMEAKQPREDYSALALLAAKDAPVSVVMPLLEAAERLTMRRAVLAIPK